MRKQIGLSSAELAHSIQISPTSLCRIENCQRPCNQSIFESALSIFSQYIPGFHFNFSEEVKDLASQQLKIWLVKYLDYSFSEDLEELERFINNPEYRNSTAFFEVKLLECFLEFFKTNRQKGILLFQNDLPLLESYLSNEFLFLAYDLMGTSHHFNLRESEEAIGYFRKAASFIQETNGSGFTALAQYHIIVSLLAEMDHISVLPLFDACIVSLQKVGAFRRMAFLETYRGICFQNLSLFFEAEEIFKNVETKIPQVNAPYLRQTVNENLMWLYLKQERYVESRKCIEQARIYHSTFPDLSLAAVWDSYNLDDSQKCLEVIAQELSLLQNTSRSNFVRSVLDLIALAVHGNEFALRKQFEKVKEALPQYKNVEADFIIYSVMSDYYYQRADYKTALSFEQMKTQFLLSQT